MERSRCVEEPTLSDVQISEIEKILGITFNNKKLLVQAITSCPLLYKKGWHENLKKGEPRHRELELLGDQILGLVILHYIIALGRQKQFQILDVAESFHFAKSNKIFSQVFVRLGLDAYLPRTDYHEMDEIYANTFEALMGAVYIDKGNRALEVVKLFAHTHMRAAILYSVDKSKIVHPKSYLQRIVRERFDEANPQYREEHFAYLPTGGKWHRATVRVYGKIIGRGEGPTLQEAKTNAAIDAIKTLSE